jgi:type IV fimbrial biogenesis protein FimT
VDNERNLLGYQEGWNMLSLRRAQGLTLIELVITVTLLGLLLLVGLPSFTTMLSNLRVRSVSESVLGGIQFARSEALKRNLSVTFQLDSVIGGGWTVLLPAAVATDPATVLQTQAASEGGAVTVVFDPPGNPSDTIIFNNLGRRITPAATTPILNVDVSNPGIATCELDGGSVRCLRVTVAIGGEARLCDPKRASGDPQACP